MEWNRRLYKKNARKTMKKNYWFLVAICFLAAVIAGEFRGSVSFLSIYSSQREQSSVFVVGAEDIRSAAQLVTGDKNHKTDFTTIQGVAEFAAILAVDYAQTDNSVISGMMLSAVRFYDSITKNGIWNSMMANSFGVILMLAFFFGIQLVLQVGKKYYLLQNRGNMEKNSRTPMRIIFDGFRKKNWKNTVKIMFFRSLFLFLWSLTIVGGVIKFYEYRMIPFLVADNPQIDRKTAFSLSRQMMQGNKFKMFLTDTSFWYWIFLQIITFGLVGMFFFTPYRSAADCEIYLALRGYCISKGIAKADVLNPMQYQQAMAEYEALPTEDHKSLIQNVEQIYRHSILSSLKPDRKYSLLTYILLFFSFALLGWLYEEILTLMKSGIFVNRGTLYGPWLPIYGFGGVGALVFFRKYEKKPVLVFLVTMCFTSLIEYASSWALEMKTGVRWWDYTGFFCNLNGRICLAGAVLFGISCCFVIYILGPLFGIYLDRIAKPTAIFICIVCIALFVVDVFFSYSRPNTGEGVTISRTEERTRMGNLCADIDKSAKI